MSLVLAFDVGNSETSVALFDRDKVRSSWRLTTNVPRTADEYSWLLASLITAARIAPADVAGSGICSVVPPVTEILTEACASAFMHAPVLVDARADLPIRLEVDEPYTVGADRVANTLAASRIWNRDCIVVDLGTATTYDCITADGCFFGGIIQPGVRSSAESLFRKTAQLGATELIPPRRVIGTRTDECIRAGVLYGAAESIDGLVRRIRSEWADSDPLVIATGGLAATIAQHCGTIQEVDPFLTLRGVYLAYEIIASSR